MITEKYTCEDLAFDKCCFQITEDVNYNDLKLVLWEVFRKSINTQILNHKGEYLMAWDKIGNSYVINKTTELPIEDISTFVNEIKNHKGYISIYDNIIYKKEKLISITMKGDYTFLIEDNINITDLLTSDFFEIKNVFYNVSEIKNCQRVIKQVADTYTTIELIKK
jgi:hypothetical protein